ncbi:MAG: imidazole glycerol phosphate synthase subunit HisH, partial [Veillonella sp.]|nr:imidazole glycerol phosphate synthase subunit HisH [Veillonella sp.]
TSTANYGIDVPGVVERGRVYGMQFHPEKSGVVGLNLLRTFGNITEAYAAVK